MEAITIEIIRTIFAGAAVLILAWVLRPLVQFFRKPLIVPEKTTSNTLFEETEEEIQIPNEAKAHSKGQVLDSARRSPMRTTQIIRQWLKEKKN